MKKDNPLENIGTGKVFLSLINGKTYPKAIADFLNIQPPPVIEQLKRLRKANFVKMGKKIGRKQNYDIVWPKIMPILIDEAIHTIKDPQNFELMDEHDFIEKIRTLKDNEHFKEFIKLYFKNISEGAPSRWYSVAEALNNFEVALAQSNQFNRDKKFEEKEKQEFFNLMRIWRKRTLDTKTWLDMNFHDALHKVLKE